MAKKATNPAAETAAPEEKPKEKVAAEAKAKPEGEPKKGKAKAKPEAEASVQAPAPAPVAAATETDLKAKTKGRAPGTPPRRGKKLRTLLNKQQNELAKAGSMPVKQAISTLKQFKRAKFDETVEIHMSLGIDTKQSDQMVRGAVALPHGIGKSVRVLVFTQGDNAAKAKAAGADHVGGAELAEKIQKEGWLDFDVALATADMMGVVGRLGKVLGPRGLMPSPKAGTVIQGDVSAAVKEFKAGKVEYRADATGNVHAPVGKMSFDETKLAENINTFIEAVRAAKPSSAKGNYMKSVTLSATMSPGIRLTL